MRRPRPAAALVAVTLSSLAALALSGPALAQAPSTTDSYSYDHDQTSWFWSHQIDPKVGPLGPLDQLRLPNPQAPDTLPVAVDQGEMEKISALQLDLALRGLPGERALETFTVTLAEGTAGGNEGHRADRRREFNAESAAIEACPIIDAWEPGAAEPWALQPDGVRPAYDPASCASGIRDDADPDRPTWTFDLTSVAREWVAGDRENDGVMLVPVLASDPGGANDAWQVNLKIPARDDGKASNGDEYQATMDQFVVAVTFAAPGPDTNPAGGGSPPAADEPPSAEASFPTFDTSGTTFNTSHAGDGAGSSRGPAQHTFRVAADVPPIRSVPRFPWFVWLLLPVGVMLLGVVRSAVIEPGEGSRPGGVVAAIRTANEARRPEAYAPVQPAPGRDAAGGRPPASLGELARRGLVGAGRLGAAAIRRMRSG